MDFLFDLAGPVAILLVFAFAVAEGGGFSSDSFCPEKRL